MNPDLDVIYQLAYTPSEISIILGLAPLSLEDIPSDMVYSSKEVPQQYVIEKVKDVRKCNACSVNLGLGSVAFTLLPLNAVGPLWLCPRIPCLAMNCVFYGMYDMRPYNAAADTLVYGEGFEQGEKLIIDSVWGANILQ